MAFNPFSLLFEKDEPPNILKAIPFPEGSTTSIEKAEVDLSRSQVSKYTGERERERETSKQPAITP